LLVVERLNEVCLRGHVDACFRYVAGATPAGWVKPTILVLLIVSAAGELFGTITVALNYRDSARVARHLAAQRAGESGQVVMTPLRVDEGAAAALLTRDRVVELLEANWVTTAGLAGLAVGAVAGAVAGAIALYCL
jgi:hypothetical protein